MMRTSRPTISLIELPQSGAFDANGTLTDEIAAGDIIRGMTRRVGNHRQFVTTALRAICSACRSISPRSILLRGRDTGTPSLNAARRDFFGRPTAYPSELPQAI
jgi:hypothetical protein